MACNGINTGDLASPGFREGFLEEETLNCVPKETGMADKHFSGGDPEAKENKVNTFLPQGLCTGCGFWLKCFPPSPFVRSWELCHFPVFAICVTLAASLY